MCGGGGVEEGKRGEAGDVFDEVAAVFVLVLLVHVSVCFLLRKSSQCFFNGCKFFMCDDGFACWGLCGIWGVV